MKYACFITGLVTGEGAETLNGSVRTRVAGLSARFAAGNKPALCFSSLFSLKNPVLFKESSCLQEVLTW